MTDDPRFLLHTTAQAKGAWPNGTRCRKVKSAKGDTHNDGALCTVLGSVRDGSLLGYFVEWDDFPGLPVGIMADRLEKA
jgi:hypothetical protein